MKRVFVDLHFCLNLKNSEQNCSITRKAVDLGYKLIGVPFASNTGRDEIERIRTVCVKNDLDMASRVDLDPKNDRELLFQLRKLRRKFEIISILCRSKTVARQAAKDRRVDILNFPVTDFRGRFFDYSEAELASKCSGCLEIDLFPLLLLEGSRRAKFLAALHRETAIANSFGVPIILSSGTFEPLHLRKPREMAAMATLFDLKSERALNAVSSNPMSIVKKNRSKLEAEFIAPGIRLVRRGRDC